MQPGCPIQTKMFQYPLNDRRFFNTADDTYIATALFTLLYLYRMAAPLNILFNRCLYMSIILT